MIYMKHIEEIKQLLVKFYAGESSQEEEACLYRYFMEQEDVPEDLTPDKEVFLALGRLGKEAEVESPASLNNDLSLLIDREERLQIRRIRTWETWARVATVAASISVVVLLGVSLIKDSDAAADVCKVRHAYVPQTEEGAIAETSRALMILSEKMTRADENLVNASIRLDNEY